MQNVGGGQFSGVFYTGEHSRKLTGNQTRWMEKQKYNRGGGYQICMWLKEQPNNWFCSQELNQIYGRTLDNFGKCRLTEIKQ